MSVRGRLEKEFYTVRDLARRIGIPQRQVRQFLADGELRLQADTASAALLIPRSAVIGLFR